jgi:hypothetical protein
MKRLATLVAAVLIALLGITPAHAIPDTGASQDTPGTSVTVSPKTLAVGGTISFRVTGFPAGEVVYVKIDDGTFCSASATHGACVLHQQRLDAHGAASGSFRLPSDVAAGKHWLRMLASQQVAGSGGGVKGYTARGNSDFTVTASKAGASSSATPTSAASLSVAATTSADGSAAASTGDAVLSAGATLSVDLPQPAVTVTVTDTPPAAATPSATSTRPVASAGTAQDGHPPYVGIIGLIVLAGLAALLVARRARRSGA